MWEKETEGCGKKLEGVRKRDRGECGKRLGVGGAGARPLGASIRARVRGATQGVLVRCASYLAVPCVAVCREAPVGGTLQ